MVTTNQKPIIETHKNKDKGPKCIIKKKSLMDKKRQKEKKKGTEKYYRNTWRTINKIAISTYLTTITLNVEGLNSPIKGTG